MILEGIAFGTWVNQPQRFQRLTKGRTRIHLNPLQETLVKPGRPPLRHIVLREDPIGRRLRIRGWLKARGSQKSSRSWSRERSPSSLEL